MVDNYYKVGGSLNANHSTYVVREADEQIFQLLKAGEYCFVFNSRQMGKSSLRVKAMKKLKAEGIRCASIDLTIIGSNVSQEKWYKGFANQLLSKLELDEVDLNGWWSSNQGWTQLQRLNLLIESVILNKLTSNIVIFLDEIDVLLKSDFQDDFFAFIRACYNQRSDDANFERLTFCLLGVATPGDLSQEKGRTPFNIGSSIELTGFSFESAKDALMPGLENVEHPEVVLQSVLNWTGGQPFLTQKLCSLIVQQIDCSNPNINQLVQKYIIQNWESQDNPEHLRTIRDRLLYNEQKAGRLLGLYQQVLNSHTCSDNPVVVDGSDEQTQLRLSGLVVKKSGYLQVYNPIYQAVFNSDWLKHELDKLRPYSQAINRWLNSRRDRSWLLQGKALHDAQAWAKGKSLSDLDYQFINASQEFSAHKAITEKEAQIKANQILALANQKASRIIRTGKIVAFILVVLSLIGVLYALHELDTAKKATALTQAGNNTAQQFESKELDALVSAMQAGQDLKELVKYKHSLAEYQTITPLTTLLNILVKIREYNQFDSAHTQLNNLSFSPDGIIASSSDDGTVKLWKQDGTRINTLFNSKDKVTSSTFSPNGKIIANSSDDGTIKLWNQNGTMITTLSGQKGKVISVTDSTIASSSNDLIKLWRLDGTLIKTCPVHSPVTSATFSRDGKILAFGTENGTVELCQPDGGVAIPQPHKGWVTSVSFSPDGKTIASGSDDKTIRLWNTYNNQIKTIQGHTARINSVSFSPDGKTIASSSNDQTVKLWDRNGSLITTLTGHNDKVRCVVFSPDGILADGSEDGIIKLWKLNVGMNRLTGYKQPVTSVSPDSIIATASDDKTIKLWKADGTLKATLSHQHQGRVTSISFSPNGKIIVNVSDDRTIQLWNGTRLITLKANALVTSLSFSPDGKIFASSHDDGTIKLWKTDGTLVATLPETHKNWVTSVSFSPDGKIIVSGGDYVDPTIKLWKLDGTLVATLKGHTKDINSISFSPDGTLIASASNDQTIKLWKSDRGNWNNYNTLTGHSDRVTSVSFSPDGQIIASGSADKTIKLWKPDGTGIDTLTGHNDGVKSVSFTLDGNIVSISQDGKAIGWSLNLDDLLAQGCEWLQDYFVTHPAVHNSLKVCDHN